MPDTGILVLGDQILGYSEVYFYCYWDISPDLSTERKCSIVNPFLRFYSAREVMHEHVQYLYTTRWMWIQYLPIPVSDRLVYQFYKQTEYSEISCYVLENTQEVKCTYESLLTQTPLVLKYPKYYNWEFIPQILNPEFQIWSHYDINPREVYLHITSDKGKNIFISSSISPEKVSITKSSPDPNNRIFKVSFVCDTIFDNGEVVTCHLSLFDVKGNHLKPGIW